ncbi:hypothetical protein llap_614 [Limosa lapponica baueri]|uniref:Uncharacterized protein n=1 Tax=Limosa lapponica baueri TaxID=1758121 RepID=A0A2I0USD8_LIMLA|nr:hypothetical protein llap_614 [Limosa lapponica baueri]
MQCFAQELRKPERWRSHRSPGSASIPALAETCKAFPTTVPTWKGGENSAAIAACPSRNLPVQQEGNLYVERARSEEETIQIPAMNRLAGHLYYEDIDASSLHLLKSKDSFALVICLQLVNISGPQKQKRDDLEGDQVTGVMHGILDSKPATFSTIQDVAHLTGFGQRSPRSRDLHPGWQRIASKSEPPQATPQAKQDQA